MKALFVLLVCAFCLSAVSYAADEDGPGGKRVLALLEDASYKSTHSIFFKSLEARGYSVTYSSASDKTVKLKKYGEWLYDHLILFLASSSDLGGFRVQDVLDFIDTGHNVLVATSSSIPSVVRTIATECNAEFDESGSFVIDHFNFDASDADGQHSLLVADNVINTDIVIGKLDAPVLFQGIGQDIEEDSPLLFAVLSASSTAYSHDPSEPIKDLHVAGKKTVLVSALQARNNARVAISGSLELFSDKFFKSPVQKWTADGKSKTYEKSGNEKFASRLVTWTFQERGILRTRDVQHHRVGEKIAPYSYTIKDDIEYSVFVEEWNGKKWVPFAANDVQLEFRMLDPYVRVNLKHDTNGRYYTQFKVPDVYGVFTFKIEYTRRGYGFLSSITRTPVRPFRHNEYERFIDSAYPYYASSFSMLVGLFIFSWFFLYHKEKK